MKPTYEEITTINPLLKNRNREDVEKLLDAIVVKGYHWDFKKKYFYHNQLKMHIRTQGLDMFTPESFDKVFLTWSDTDYRKSMIAVKLIFTLIKIWILFFALGWLILPISLWLSILLIFGLIITFKYSKFKKSNNKNSL